MLQDVEPRTVDKNLLSSSTDTILSIPGRMAKLGGAETGSILDHTLSSGPFPLPSRHEMDGTTATKETSLHYCAPLQPGCWFKITSQFYSFTGSESQVWYDLM